MADNITLEGNSVEFGCRQYISMACGVDDITLRMSESRQKRFTLHEAVPRVREVKVVGGIKQPLYQGREEGLHQRID